MSDLVFTERFRPDTLDEVKGNEQAVERLKEWRDDESIPHILLSGPSGTGKTSMTLAFAKDIYGDEWQQNVLEVNASDTRGIDYIRDKVKKFAQRSAPLGSPVDYNMVFLDEADMLTKESQSALRRIMEDYSGQTKFFLSCNWKSQIIDAIQSRCFILDIEPLSDEEVTDLLSEKIEEIGATADDETIEKIVDHSGGDLRIALNTLQASVSDGEVSSEAVDQFTTGIDTDGLVEILDLSVKGEIDSAFTKFDRDYLKAGTDPGRICEALMEIVLDTEYPHTSKVKMIEAIGEGDWRVQQGGNPAIHMHSMLAQLSAARFMTYGEDNE